MEAVLALEQGGTDQKCQCDITNEMSVIWLFLVIWHVLGNIGIASNLSTASFVLDLHGSSLCSAQLKQLNEAQAGAGKLMLYWKSPEELLDIAGQVDVSGKIILPRSVVLRGLHFE